MTKKSKEYIKGFTFLIALVGISILILILVKDAIDK